jgi:hypothetical protein
MSAPGFTAASSLYKTNASYTALREGSRGGNATIFDGGGWTIPLAGSPTFQDHSNLHAGPSIFHDRSTIHRCGGLGGPCCKAPFQNVAAFGPYVSCNEGLGCDISTGKCVAPCGGTGQVCCDGPETRAPRWTVDGRVYSPNYPGLREMCNQGGCDLQMHRCGIPCGTQDNDPCCPPDAKQATAHCVGPNLECHFDSVPATSGTCHACGSQGKPPCRRGCDFGLGIRNGLCDICGGYLQLPCDQGCNPGLGSDVGLCLPCGDIGEIPCDGGCNGGLGIKNGLCAVCGGQDQPPCDAGCNEGTTLIWGVCTRCGSVGQPPCSGGCRYSWAIKVVNGVCRLCGNPGQIPCDSGCNPGLLLINGLCASAPVPRTCSSVGEPCAPDNLPGWHCCQNPNAPEVCVNETCRACVPHGQECLPYSTWICCGANDGDICKLDQSSGKIVCDIPG